MPPSGNRHAGRTAATTAMTPSVRDSRFPTICANPKWNGVGRSVVSRFFRHSMTSTRIRTSTSSSSTSRTTTSGRRVNDPETAKLLSATNHPFGSKRLCVDIDYFETYNRDNVSLVDISANPIETITPSGLRTEKGTGYDFDALIFAIGFDAMTGPLMAIDIRGRDGLKLREKWDAGPRTILGLVVAGFPQPLHHHRSAESVRTHQHDERHRATR